MSAPAVTAPADATVGDTIRLLIDKKISSVFVTDGSDDFGIVTERDLLRALDTAGQKGLETLLGSIAKKPLQSVLEDDFLYRAIGRMQRLGFRHLAVRDARGKLTGAVTTRNLLRHRATTAIVLGDEIDSAKDVAALAQAWAKLPRAGAQPAGGHGRSPHDRRRHQRGGVRSDAAGRRAGGGEAAGGRQGAAARTLRGAGAGLGRPRRIAACRRPGQRHRLRDGRAGRPRGPMVRGARHRDRRHPRRGGRAVLQGRGDGPQPAMAHERRPLEGDHRELGAPPAAQGPAQCRYLLRRRAGARGPGARRGDLDLCL